MTIIADDIYPRANLVASGKFTLAVAAATAATTTATTTQK